MTQDEEHLRLLAIFRYVVGGLAGLSVLFVLFPMMIYLTATATKVSSLSASAAHGEESLLALFDWFFFLFACVFVAAGWTLAVCVVAAGRFLAQRRHYLFCLVVAGIECTFQPFGTVLGVFTLIVLMRDTVKRLFSASESSDSPGLAQT